MASLEKLANLLSVELPAKDKKVTGIKRRSWLPVENDKGSINHVYEPGLSTVSINQVDEHGLDKGSINLVDKQCLSKLRGNPLRLMQFLYQISSSEEGNISRKTSLSEMMQVLNMSRDSARTALRFILKNNMLSRVKNKVGKNGWSQYRINESLFCEIEEATKTGALEPFSNSKNYEKHKGSNSSSSNYLKTTTDLTDDWKNIDCEPLADIGFSVEHLKQLVKFSSPEVVQQSIYHLAFQMEKETVSNPLNQLMGTLRKGGPWFVVGYKSKKERALEEVLEARQKEQARLAKMEAELLELDFNEWLSKLSEDEQRPLVNPISWNNRSMKKAELKKYFIENVYKK